MLQNRLLELVREIEDMKAQLVTLFETKSCSLQGAVLQKSQELDLLIVQYYRLLRGERAAGGSRLQPRPIRNRR
ncbi:aspartyl-phosphate phosphatase Spo0E family protein [Effusibacillus pohliae]|uniref:aspartyl-phosphate phosphatase Spo0E family protein n=1 Tax=Effusibacillus pohliae TaxID=232270 RepID=UPI000373A14A|nr:aspartyl-phosphate phosphatase Spo0E family protein [Effusibacillus pohliae]